jgi:hypothetical protein
LKCTSSFDLPDPRLRLITLAIIAELWKEREREKNKKFIFTFYLSSCHLDLSLITLWRLLEIQVFLDIQKLRRFEKQLKLPTKFLHALLVHFSLYEMHLTRVKILKFP